MSRVRRAVYYGAVGGTAAMMLGVGYTLYRDLRYEGGRYPIVEQACEQLAKDPQIVQLLGGTPFTVMGRRRPAVFESWAPEDGRKCLDTHFWITGGSGSAEVQVQMVEGEGRGEWIPKYLSIKLPEAKEPRILVQPVPPEQQRILFRQGGWSPFSKWFSP